MSNNSKKPIIGKNVIETLTLGMYEDCRFVYREYIQNSADQIDIAVEEGVLASRNDGYIGIIIEQNLKKITIEDNATGIKSSDVLSLLGNIAASTKDRTKRKGFRGIGRLGGLGYCKKLTFETSSVNESVKSIMEWDAAQLKHIIENPKYNIEAAEVISAITNYSVKEEEEQEHYFRVILEDVSDEKLLNTASIREYIAQVAPISFSHTQFYFDTKIYAKAKEEKISIDEYPVFVNDEQVFKPYKTDIYKYGKKDDEVFEIEFIKIYDKSRHILAWGWYSITEMKGVIPPENIARGFRLRKGNIQIGLENALEKLQYSETRFNYHYFGEIHTFHPDLIPNARRDYFVENEICNYLNKELRAFFHNTQQLAHTASKIRSAQTKLQKVDELKKEYTEISTNKGFDNKAQIKEFEVKFVEAKQRAEDAKKSLEKIKDKFEENKAVNRIFAKIVDEQTVEQEIDVKFDFPKKVIYRTDKLSKLDNRERKIVERVFKVIDSVINRDLAENLKNLIEEEFIK
jgi:molecular chaperone HtpG